MLSEVDTLYLPGGQPGNYRTNTAFECWKIYPESRIVISEPLVGDVFPMQAHLIEKGIPENQIYIEQDSIDTLSGLIRAAQIFSLLDSSKIGIVTDPFHMNRTYTLANRIYGDMYDFVPIRTNYKEYPLFWIKDFLSLQAALTYIRNIEPGDFDGFEEFLSTKHPGFKEPPNLFFENYLKVRRFIGQLAKK